MGLEERLGSSPAFEGLRGRKEPMGVGGRAIGGVRRRTGGAPSSGGGGFDSPGLMVRARLYSRQQVGHRHSTTRPPSGLL
jgi:hypothetical protein